MNKVAVITRTKNRPILLRRAVDSIKRQTFRDFVWVVVNDGGDVGSVEKIVRPVAESFEVRIIHNTVSIGMEAASNAGIRASESSYIVIHDDDDSWDSSFLKETTNFLESDRGERYGGVVTHSVLVKEKIRGDHCKFVSRQEFNKWMQAVYLVDMSKNNCFPPISFLFRRVAYEMIGGYNASLPVLGDWDFNLRFLLKYDIFVIQKPLANYHHRVGNECNYGNSVIHGDRTHKEFDAIIRNRLLREDLSSQISGLGYLVNLVKEYEGLDSIVSWQSFKRILSRTRFEWIARYL